MHLPHTTVSTSPLTPTATPYSYTPQYNILCRLCTKSVKPTTPSIQGHPSPCPPSIQVTNRNTSLHEGAIRTGGTLYTSFVHLSALLTPISLSINSPLHQPFIKVNLYAFSSSQLQTQPHSPSHKLLTLHALFTPTITDLHARPSPDYTTDLK
jgi:hypothetical protein